MRTAYWTVILPSGRYISVNCIPRNKPIAVSKVVTVGKPGYASHALLISEKGRIYSPSVRTCATFEGPSLKGHDWLLRGFKELGVLTAADYDEALKGLALTVEQREVDDAVHGVLRHLDRLGLAVPKQLQAKFNKLTNVREAVEMPHYV